MMNLQTLEPQRVDSEDTPERVAALEGVSVLVVDDEEEARDAIAAVLEESGAVVTALGSASAAIQVIERLKPDVLVSDIAMPSMDGHALIRRVRALDAARGGGTPAAALTAYASRGDRTRALLAGYQVYLAKPFEPAELVALVATLAGRTGNA